MSEQRGVKVQGLTHWAIPVNDLEESRRFYTEILGMEDRGPVGPVMHCVGFGDTNILLSVRPTPVPRVEDRDGLTHIAFRVRGEDMDRAIAGLRAWGVQVTPEFDGGTAERRGDVEIRRVGVFTGRSLYFLDPSGNQLELNDPNLPPDA